MLDDAVLCLFSQSQICHNVDVTNPKLASTRFDLLDKMKMMYFPDGGDQIRDARENTCS